MSAKNNQFSLSAVHARYERAFAEAWHFNATPEAHATVANLGRDLAECYEDMGGYRALEIAREHRALAAQHDEAANNLRAVV